MRFFLCLLLLLFAVNVESQAIAYKDTCSSQVDVTKDTCGCLAAEGCGFCAYKDNEKNSYEVQSWCIGGNTNGPTGTSCGLAVAPAGKTTVWVYGSSMASDCKAGKTAAIAVPVAIGGALIVFFIFWWATRGRYWWRSTSHRRCCCHPEACCKGCLCFHPYDAQPPPHSTDPNSRKAKAVRVAPCYPHNPCATCMGGPEKPQEYKDAHPCGLGLACECHWMPGCCCFKWPHFCLKIWCEDEMPTVPGQFAAQVIKNVKKARSFLPSFCGGGGGGSGNQQQQQQQQQHQGHGQYGDNSSNPYNNNNSNNYGAGGNGTFVVKTGPPQTNSRMVASAGSASEYNSDYNSQSESEDNRKKKNPYPAPRK